MFTTQNLQLPLDPQWGKSLSDTLGNWNTHSSFDEYNKRGGFSSALSSPRGRLHNPQSTLQHQTRTEIGLSGSHDASDMMEDICMADERCPTPQYVSLSQPSPPRRQLRRQSHRQISTEDSQQTFPPELLQHRVLQSPPEESHAYQGIRQDSHYTGQQPHGVAARIQLQRDRRLARRMVTTHRSEQNILPELPPAYSFHDPTLPLPFPTPGPTLLERWRVQPQQECAQIHSNSFSGGLSGAIEGVHGHIKDIPKIVKTAPARLRTHRARQKLKWLQKHNYLGEEERYLSSDLMG
jgi:hypothetical protein